MKAAYIVQTGEPDVIQYGDLPTPEPEPHQVLVRVRAVSVNPIDTYIRSGMIPFELPKPYIIGCDFAGTVEATGSEVTRYKPGDRVWGSNQGLLGRQGTFAQYVAVNEAWVYRTPTGVDDEEVAALALVGITAHLGLFEKARLKRNETIFVAGGSGGVGSVVIQMAKLAGARVITSAGNEAKVEICRELGADEVIRYRERDLAEAVRQLAPEGVHVWFDVRREPDFMQAVPLLRPSGRMVIMAGRDATPAFPVGPFYTRDCKLFGYAMFNATSEKQRECAEDINHWLSERKLRANICKTMKLAEAAEAHRIQEENTIHHAGKLSGKIVLTP
ncbi:MAG TPA: NADPH:quinone reductase [Candidatus Hydrogenedentes bacterium]|mgnify:CR=1 FL=1|nr:NADPH:quinone reductase [Candidatus Hydrogenedentota bacterium]